jgi:hypothetical protein
LLVIFWFRLIHRLIAFLNHWVSRNIQQRFKWKKLIWMLSCIWQMMTSRLCSYRW